MAERPTREVRTVDEAAQDWAAHPRFATIFVKRLLTGENGGPAAVSRVQVPVGESIGRHLHESQVETIYVLSGRSRLTLGEDEVSFNSGHIVPVPVGTVHSLDNVGSEPVELLCIFTNER
jgi:quercetin dioxygenase-like cupin family protein